MRTATIITAALGLSAGLALGGGVSAERALDRDNAALAYYRAWATMGPDLDDALLVDAQTLSLAPGTGEDLEEAREAINDLLEASEILGVDWEIKYEDGFAALMPHLGKMRAGAKVIAADALRCAAEGDATGAAERAASLFRMTQHLHEDRVLISTLVSMAIGNLGTDLSTQLLDSGLLNADDAGLILEAIEEGDGEDRYGMRSSILGEWHLMSEYIVSNAPEEDAGEWLFDQISIASGSEASRRVKGMDRDALLRQLGGFAAFHGAMLGAWDNRDGEAMNACERDLINGDYGPLPELLAPSITRAFDSYLKSAERTEVLTARLEEIAG